jgi:sterol desaturase/sphingolipid hydroxylase (fatty acid hydroxylase superfamily)/uncharacterized membrane protein YhhN
VQSLRVLPQQSSNGNAPLNESAMSKVIVFATPVFLLLIALEFFWSRTRFSRTHGQRAYRLNDAINSISLGILSQLGGVTSKVLTIGIYTLVFQSVALWPALEFWSSVPGYVVALLVYDFCYYWLHRYGHEVAVLWAAHVVHHQSQQYNLSTALRQTASGPLLGWIFYLPMALMGVPPLVFGIVALIDLLYQFWVHTEQVGKLGWFDRVFCSPSNHRVHHAVNDRYIDRNYGGLLVLWDRWFGTFQEEDEPCVYGTRGALNSWDPLWANLEVYWSLARDSWNTRNWGDKLRLWFKPPGWQPDDLRHSAPKPPFRLEQVSLYDPALSTGQQVFAAVQFVAALGAVSVFLWNADAMAVGTAWMWIAGLGTCLWALGLFMQQRLNGLEVLGVQCAVLATLSGAGLMGLHMLFKPLVMVFALAVVVRRAKDLGGFKKHDLLLCAALTLSLGGDVFLMLPGNYFIPGLASFLVAHVFYLLLFRQGAPWFASKAGLACTLGVGALMYGWVWSGLPDPILQAAVAVYVMVIALMAAQAMGRARTFQLASARWVGAATCVFMLSDALIAVDRFVAHIPLAPLWILSTYYVAQWLIVHQTLSGGATAFMQSQRIALHDA